MTLRTAGLAGAALALIAVGVSLAANEEDNVLARVDGAAITSHTLGLAEQDVGQALGQLPAETKQSYLVDYLTDMKVLALSAEKQGLGEDETFKRRLAYLRDKALMEALLEREVAKVVTDESVRAFYDGEVSKAPKEEEAHARHILVESEDEAKAIIEQLKGGGDFAAIAKEKTKDPAGKENGGDLDFFTKGQMVPEFSEAAFALAAGQMTETPIKTQFGWHVIKLEEKREKQPPGFDEISDRVRVFLIRKAQTELVAKLKTDYQIEKVAPPPGATPEAPAAPGTPDQSQPPAATPPAPATPKAQ